MQSNVLKAQKNFLLLFSAFLIGTVGIAIYFQNYFLLLGPMTLLSMLLISYDYRILYFATILTIPISIHFFFGNLALDVLSEPLLISITIISPFLLILNMNQLGFIKHPISVLIILQFIWAMIASITSVDLMVSIKYLLAKLWFIIPIFFIGALIIKSFNDVKKVFWLFFTPLLIVCIITIIKHAKEGFSFEAANLIMNPFFMNHVIYSTTIAVFIPFVIYARYWYPQLTVKRSVINFGLLVFVFSVASTYTRASWLALIFLVPAYFVVNKKLMKMGLVVSLIGLGLTLIYIYHNNKYLDFAKEYKKVIFHKGDIEGHLEATYQFEDVSGMERVYRWVAAKNMIRDNFLLGTGPNTFYPEYKKYTVTMFETYVSDNPEKSTTHNYFLMAFTEQGILGFLLFSSLYIYLLLKGTELSSTFKDNNKNNLAMATTLSLIVLLLHLFFNDLIETDKIGFLFYFSCLLIVKLDSWSKESTDQKTLQEI